MMRRKLAELFASRPAHFFTCSTGLACSQIKILLCLHQTGKRNYILLARNENKTYVQIKTFFLRTTKQPADKLYQLHLIMMLIYNLISLMCNITVSCLIRKRARQIQEVQSTTDFRVRKQYLCLIVFSGEKMTNSAFCRLTFKITRSTSKVQDLLSQWCFGYTWQSIPKCKATQIIIM